MNKPQFTKHYHSGTFRDLIKMYSFDRHVPTHQTQSWADMKKITLADNTQIEVVTGVSETIARSA